MVKLLFAVAVAVAVETTSANSKQNEKHIKIYKCPIYKLVVFIAIFGFTGTELMYYMHMQARVCVLASVFVYYILEEY